MKTPSPNRTRLLGGILLVCLVAAAADSGSLGRVLGPIRERQQTIKTLEQSIEQQQQQLLQIHTAELRARHWQQRSLPADVSQAMTRYQHWLVTQLRELGLDRATVTPESPLVRQDYQLVPIQVETELSLSAFANLLDRFEHAPALQRLTRLQIAPVEHSGQNAGQIKVALQLEALSLIGPLQTPSSESVDPFIQDALGRRSPPYLAARLQDRNPFAASDQGQLAASETGTDPEVEPADEPDGLQGSAITTDDEPDESDLRLVATFFRGDSKEAWLFDAENQEHQIVRERERLDLPQGACVVSRIAPHIIELVFADQRLQVPLGGLLSVPEDLAANPSVPPNGR